MSVSALLGLNLPQIYTCAQAKGQSAYSTARGVFAMGCSPLSRSGKVWAKPLSARNSSAALLMGGGPGLQPDCTTNSTVFFADLGYTAATKCTVRDLVARLDLGMFTGACPKSHRS